MFDTDESSVKDRVMKFRMANIKYHDDRLERRGEVVVRRNDEEW